LALGTNNISRVLVDTNGNVGIANSSPTTTLGVTGNAYVSGNITAGNYLNLANNSGGVSGHMVYNPTLISIDFTFN